MYSKNSDVITSAAVGPPSPPPAGPPPVRDARIAGSRRAQTGRHTFSLSTWMGAAVPGNHRKLCLWLGSGVVIIGSIALALYLVR